MSSGERKRRRAKPCACVDPAGAARAGLWGLAVALLPEGRVVLVLAAESSGKGRRRG